MHTCVAHDTVVTAFEVSQKVTFEVAVEAQTIMFFACVWIAPDTWFARQQLSDVGHDAAC